MANRRRKKRKAGKVGFVLLTLFLIGMTTAAMCVGAFVLYLNLVIKPEADLDVNGLSMKFNSVIYYNDDDGQQHLAHLSPQLHDARGGRHKQQREDAGEEQAHFLDLLELHDAEAERGQEQQQAVDAGRDGEREHCVADLAQKTERQNARKLKQIVRKDASFGSTEQENTK